LISLFQTEKEGVIAYPFVDSDALPVVKAIIEGTRDKSDNERIITVQEEELTTMMQQLAARANINLGGKHLRFHCLRKYLIDRLSSMMSESKWKQIVGKAISEGAYVSSLELRESYTKVMKLTTCITNGNGKVSRLDQDVQELKKQLSDITYAFDVLMDALKQQGLLGKGYTIQDLMRDHEQRIKEGQELIDAENRE
jgi:hypothetical protein